RAFNPVLMRFNSPDSSSPFGEGGLNSYAYCIGDPINRIDPTGHTWKPLKVVLRRAGLMRPSDSVTQPVASRNPPATTGTIPSQTFNNKSAAGTTRDIIAGNAPAPYSGYSERNMTASEPVRPEDPNRWRLMLSLFRADIRSLLQTGARHRAPVAIIINHAERVNFRPRDPDAPPSYDELFLPSYSEAMNRIRDGLK
ncbi:hypothetical protein CFII68_18000, partial [Pseudomonas sp. CFII68]